MSNIKQFNLMCSTYDSEKDAIFGCGAFLYYNRKYCLNKKTFKTFKKPIYNGDDLVFFKTLSQMSNFEDTDSFCYELHNYLACDKIKQCGFVAKNKKTKKNQEEFKLITLKEDGNYYIIPARRDDTIYYHTSNIAPKLEPYLELNSEDIILFSNGKKFIFDEQSIYNIPRERNFYSEEEVKFAKLDNSLLYKLLDDEIELKNNAQGLNKMIIFNPRSHLDFRFQIGFSKKSSTIVNPSYTFTQSDTICVFVNDKIVEFPSLKIKPSKYTASLCKDLYQLALDKLSNNQINPLTRKINEKEMYQFFNLLVSYNIEFNSDSNPTTESLVSSMKNVFNIPMTVEQIKTEKDMDIKYFEKITAYINLTRYQKLDDEILKIKTIKEKIEKAKEKKVKVPKEKKVKIPKKNTIKDVPRENTTKSVPKETTTKYVPKENTTKYVPKENTTKDIPKENITKDVPKENTIIDVAKEKATKEFLKENNTKDVPKENTIIELPKEKTKLKKVQTTEKNTKATEVQANVSNSKKDIQTLIELKENKSKQEQEKQYSIKDIFTFMKKPTPPSGIVAKDFNLTYQHPKQFNKFKKEQKPNILNFDLNDVSETKKIIDVDPSVVLKVEPILNKESFKNFTYIKFNYHSEINPYNLSGLRSYHHLGEFETLFTNTYENIITNTIIYDEKTIQSSDFYYIIHYSIYNYIYNVYNIEEMSDVELQSLYDICVKNICCNMKDCFYYKETYLFYSTLSNRLKETENTCLANYCHILHKICIDLYVSLPINTNYDLVNLLLMQSFHNKI